MNHLVLCSRFSVEILPTARRMRSLVKATGVGSIVQVRSGMTWTQTMSHGLMFYREEHGNSGSSTGSSTDQIPCHHTACRDTFQKSRPRGGWRPQEMLLCSASVVCHQLQVHGNACIVQPVVRT